MSEEMNNELMSDADKAMAADASPMETAAEKKDNLMAKKIFFAAALVVIIAVVIIPMFSKKPEKNVTAGADSTAVQDTVAGDEISLEEQQMKSRKFEELSEAERMALLAKANPDTAAEDSAGILPPPPGADPMNPMSQQQQPVENGAKNPQASNSSSVLPNPNAGGYKWKADRETQKLLDNDFGAATAFYKDNAKDGRWVLNEGAFSSAAEKAKNLASSVNPENMYLLDGNPIVTTGNKHVLPATSCITALTRGVVDSDYPTNFVAVVSRPNILKGWKLICTSSSNKDGRIPVSIDRLISPEGKEMSINGIVQMGSTPGLTGNKQSRWYKRMGPSMINGAIGGGLLAYSMKEKAKDRANGTGTGGVAGTVESVVNPNVQVSTTDQIIEPIIQEGIGGLQQEVKRSFSQGTTDDRVVVPENTMFDILLLSSFSVTL